jgi:hypothetical protein
LLNECALLQSSSLIDPATILGAHLIAIAETSVRLKHPATVGLKHNPLGLFHGFRQPGTHHVDVDLPGTILVFFDCADKILHTQLSKGFPAAMDRLPDPISGVRDVAPLLDNPAARNTSRED